MRVALHTTLRADPLAEHETAHREAPTAVSAGIRVAGDTGGRIQRSGTDLVHRSEAVDFAAVNAEPATLSASAVRQTGPAGLLGVAHQRSSGGADFSPPVAREL
ncbi:L-rhamnose mutarotase [Streptomyces sp. E5N91]|uniref:L-rhamnose mutarotase n=1 Tax=Streptomyces sp. E5N91 TaxID=1851996 RepID=UPI000EF58773|nr:L-rhamnose mutarotase [Streptomyces sp. E5N91]